MAPPAGPPYHAAVDLIDEAMRRRARLATRRKQRADDATDRDLAALLRASAHAPRPPRAPATTTVVARRQLTPTLLVLRLARPAGFTFSPGQYVKLALDGVRRDFTLCSAPHQDHLELFVELQPQGRLTPRLFALRPGDPVGLAPKAGGAFALAPDARHHVMVATVTGVAPFVSMLRDAAHRGATARFHVLHGASYADELGYGDALAALGPRVTYLPSVSRPAEPRNAGFTGATGRVATLLEPYLDQHALTPADTVVYACGHPEMVADVRQRMRRRGFPVRVEIFD